MQNFMHQHLFSQSPHLGPLFLQPQQHQHQDQIQLHQIPQGALRGEVRR